MMEYYREILVFIVSKIFCYNFLQISPIFEGLERRKYEKFIEKRSDVDNFIIGCCKCNRNCWCNSMLPSLYKKTLLIESLEPFVIIVLIL